MTEVRAPSTYLSDPEGNIIGMVGLDGREYLFPEALVATISTPATEQEVHAIYRDGVPIGLATPAGDRYFPEALTSGSPTGARRLAIGVRELVSSTSVIGLISGRGFGFPSPLIAIGPVEPPTGPTLGLLTLGAITLTAGMAPGATVAVINGKTGGSTVTMTGTAFTSNKLAVNVGGTAIVVGTAGPLTEGDTTGTFSLTETLAGATNTPRVSGPFSSITVAAAGGGLGYSKLVYPADPFWYDTKTNGQVLSPMADYQTGAGYIITLEAIGAQAQPASDAVTYSGGNYVAGPGFAALNPDTYALRTLNVLSGLMSETDIEVVSNKASAYPVCNSVSDLNTHLATIGNQISTNLAAFEAAGGAALDLNPSVNFGTYILTQIPNSTQTKKVTLRSAATDRVNGAKPRFNGLTVAGERHVRLQSLEFRPPAGVANGDFIQPTAASPFFSIFNCDMAGGSWTWAADGTATYNPDVPTSTSSFWLPEQTAFHGTIASGAFTRIDMVAGHTRSFTQAGAAIGVWKAADPSAPAYIGRNLTGGVAGASLPLVTTGGAGAGTGFAGQIEVVELVGSTPVVSVHTGQSYTKPGPVNGENAPDGLYIISWRLSAAGTGYTNRSGVNAQGTVRQAGGVDPGALWTLIKNNSGTQQFTDLVISRVRGRSFSQAISLPISTAGAAYWITGNDFDGCFGGDFIKLVYSVSHTWSQSEATRFRFNKIGRVGSSPNGFANIHSDLMQTLISSSGGPWNASPYQEWVGNIGWAYGGYGGAQGLFYTGITRPTIGARYRGIGNLYAMDNGGSYSYQYSLSRGMHEWSDYDMSSSSFGTQVTVEPYTDTTNPRLNYQNKGISGSRPSTVALAETPEQTFRDMVRANIGNTGVFDDPILTWTDSVAEIVRRMTPKAGSGAVGYGPFADKEQIIDHVNRVFNPNPSPFRLLLPVLSPAPPSSNTVTEARQIQSKTAATLTAISNASYCIGATRTAARAGPFVTTVPVTIPRGQWIAYQLATSSFDGTNTFGSVTIDGVVQSVRARTANGPNIPAAAPGNEPTIVSATPYNNGASSNTWTLFSGVSVPAGGEMWVVLVSDGDVVGTVTEDGLELPALTINDTVDADWELMGAYLHNGDSSFLFRYRNTTAGAVPKALAVQISQGAAEQMRANAYVFQPATAGATCNSAFSVTQRGTPTNPRTMPTVDLDTTRRTVWVAACTVSQQETAASSTPPPGFTNEIAADGSANSAGVSVVSARLTGVVNNTLSPGDYTMSVSRVGIDLTLAIWEVVP